MNLIMNFNTKPAWSQNWSSVWLGNKSRHSGHVGNSFITFPFVCTVLFARMKVIDAKHRFATLPYALFAPFSKYYWLRTTFFVDCWFVKNECTTAQRRMTIKNACKGFTWQQFEMNVLTLQKKYRDIVKEVQSAGTFTTEYHNLFYATCLG